MLPLQKSKYAHLFFSFSSQPVMFFGNMNNFHHNNDRQASQYQSQYLSSIPSSNMGNQPFHNGSCHNEKSTQTHPMDHLLNYLSPHNHHQTSPSCYSILMGFQANPQHTETVNTQSYTQVFPSTKSNNMEPLKHTLNIQLPDGKSCPASYQRNIHIYFHNEPMKFSDQPDMKINIAAKPSNSSQNETSMLTVNTANNTFRCSLNSEANVEELEETLRKMYTEGTTTEARDCPLLNEPFPAEKTGKELDPGSFFDLTVYIRDRATNKYNKVTL